MTPILSLLLLFIHRPQPLLTQYLDQLFQNWLRNALQEIKEKKRKTPPPASVNQAECFHVLPRYYFFSFCRQYLFTIGMALPPVPTLDIVIHLCMSSFIHLSDEGAGVAPGMKV